MFLIKKIYYLEKYDLKFVDEFFFFFIIIIGIGNSNWKYFNG